MPIISVRYNENDRWKGKNKGRKKQGGGASYSESVISKWFCFTSKLDLSS